MPETPQKSKSQHKIDWWLKWIAAIAVPLAVALIGAIKIGGGSGETRTAGNLTLVTDVTLIENQFQQYSGQPLADADTKTLIQSAVNLAKAGQIEASRKLFEQLAAKVPVPAVYSNLAALDAESGDFQASRQALQDALAKDPNFGPAQQNLASLARLEKPVVRDVSAAELEPNNDFNHTNLIPLNRKIAAEVSPGTDVDYFQFTTPSGPRDIYRATLENNSTSLLPAISVFDGNRQRLNPSDQCTSGQPVAHIECFFSADPSSLYYVEVSSNYGSTGAYTLMLEPLKRYDAYEPNDDFPQAKSISAGTPIEANIMDAADKDFYIVQAKSSGTLTASLDNGSTTLDPKIILYDANRHQLSDPSACTSGEPLAHLDCAVPAEAGASYYVQVLSNYGTAGAYKLVVK